MRGASNADLPSYARAFYLLVRHPQVMLGPLLAGVLQILLNTVMPASDNGFVASANSGLAGLFGQLLTSFGLGVAVIVADAAWRYGKAPFDDAWDQARRRGGEIIMAALGVSFVTYVAQLAGAIIPFGALLLGAVATYFMIYAIPAAAIGGIPGFGSLQVSVERARGNVVPTVLLTLLYVFAFFVAPILLVNALEPLLVTHAALTSRSTLSLILAFVKAPIGGYVGLMLAKTYENVSYGRLR